MLGRLYELNSTGKTIWELCDGNHTVGEIKDILREEYDDADKVSVDITEFLKKLLQLNLVEIR